MVVMDTGRLPWQPLVDGQSRPVLFTRVCVQTCAVAELLFVQLAKHSGNGPSFHDWPFPQCLAS